MLKQIIIIPLDNPMSAGKLAAQASHAAVGAALTALREDVDDWMQDGMTKIVCQIPSTPELLELCADARKANFPTFLVRDEGRTEVVPNSITALAIGPHPHVDTLTGRLALYKDVK